MNKEEVCKNCKFHDIEEISFDYPQSICKKEDKIYHTTEEWLICDDFVYSEEYVKQLQQENKQLKERIDKAMEEIDLYIPDNPYLNDDGTFTDSDKELICNVYDILKKEL